MKANEYYKKMGWNFANIKLAEMEHAKQFNDFYHDLKRIVESHELVEQLGGIAKTKEAFGLCVFRNRASYAKRVEQAIADVESYQ